MKKAISIFSTLLLLVLFSGSLSARNYYRTPHQMAQPNGDTITVYLCGSDLYIEAESEDQYTLVKDSSSSEICYAMLSKDGNEYLSSGIAYKGGATPDEVKFIIPQKLRINKESRDRKIARTKKLINKFNPIDSISSKPTLRAAIPLNDTVYGLCLLIDFQDVKSNVTVNQIETFLNGDNNPVFGNKSSIKEYFQWISNGKLTYINFLPDQYYTANGTMEDFSPKDASDYTINLLYPEIENAINKWADKNPEKLKKLTHNQYGGGIKAINILYAGTCPNQWATGLWPHQSYFDNDTQVKVKGWNRMVDIFGQNQTYHGYQISDIGSKLSMGTFIHESGHLVCEWPDFYQYEEHEPANNAEPYNIGDAFNIANEYNPTYPNPWVLDQMGWLDGKLIDITNITDGRIIKLEKGCGNVAVYRGKGNNYMDSYYLEVRDRHYYHGRTNQESGIFIWHSYDEGSNLYPGEVEQLECRPATKSHPFWTNKTGPAIFDDNSDPSGQWRDGEKSGIYLWDFSEGGDVMTFRCGEYIEKPEFVTTSLTQALINKQYRDSIILQGGEAPYIYSLYDGTLPTGIELSSEGLIQGTPTVAGETSFTIKVTDQIGNTTFQEFTLKVVKPTPLTGKPFPIPGVIQTEDYDLGGEGVAYHALRNAEINKIKDAREDQEYFPMVKVNGENYEVEFAYEGEWIQYSINVAETQTYVMGIQNAVKNDVIISFVVDDVLVDTMSIPGKYSNPNFWTTVSTEKITRKEIMLERGSHDFKIVAESVPSKLKIDSINFLAAPTTGMKELSVQEPYITRCQGDGFLARGLPLGAIIHIYTPQAETVERINVTNDTQRFGENYTKGIYIVKIESEYAYSTFKVIKE